MQSLDALNAADQAGFVADLGAVFEHAPWAAEAAWSRRPFATVTALHAAMLAAIAELPEAAQIGFLAGHPDLALPAVGMTEASVQEQASAGLDRLSAAERERFAAANAAYRQRFGFPFIIAVRRHTRRSIRARFEQRLRQDRAVELAAALAEIGHITRLRLVERVSGPGMPAVTGRLSTHVLDTVAGGAAAGVGIRLAEVDSDGSLLPLAEATTDGDGRVAVLLGGRPLPIGVYQLSFAIGAYFRARGTLEADMPFLDEVPVRFGIAEPEAHYHVPLLASPASYTTYRGG